MGAILKLFGGSKVMFGLVLALLASTAAAGVVGKMYLSKRDALAKERAESDRLERSLSALQGAFNDREREIRALEQARVDLANQVSELESQGVEVRTEIQTQWRDRVVRESFPVAVECASEPMPPSVVGLLKCASGGSGCAVPEDAD